LTARRGGRSSGFVISLFVIAFYYVIFIYSWKAGVYFQIFPIKVGIWIANVLTAGVGLVLLWLADSEKFPLRRLVHHPFWAGIYPIFGKSWKKIKTVWSALQQKSGVGRFLALEHPLRPARVMDMFVFREYLKILGLTLFGAMLLFTIFRLFDIIDKIYAHHVPWSRVVEYFIYASPMLIVQMLPLCVLISLLICFGILEKTNQVTALKASGISVYRIFTPVIFLVILLSSGVFILQEFILPHTNQRFDNLHKEIWTGHKVQTSYGPDLTWIMGKDGKIYNYSHFDYDRNVFVDLSVYHINLSNAVLTSRYFAHRAFWDNQLRKWILMNGWKREFGELHAHFSRYDTLTLNLGENPSHFKTKLKRSDKMAYAELSRYINRLKHGGFNTLNLEVDLYKKISYPLVSIIMLVIGFPFSFIMGKKGALYGIAVSVFVGILYWALFNIFSVMGGHGLVPSILAAWAPNLFFGFAGFFLALHVRT